MILKPIIVGMAEESENVVIYVENENIANKEIVKSSLIDTVKNYVKKLLDQWNPDESDFIVLKVSQTVSLDLPLSKELYRRVEKYGVKRSVIRLRLRYRPTK